MFHQNGKLVAPRPHLRILKVSMYECEEISNDALSIRGYSELRCNDYHLGKFMLNGLASFNHLGKYTVESR